MIVPASVDSVDEEVEISEKNVPFETEGAVAWSKIHFALRLAHVSLISSSHDNEMKKK